MQDPDTAEGQVQEDAWLAGAGPGVPRTYAVMSARGGCGGTLVATQLALALAEAGSACILDLDGSKGDVAGFLDVPSTRSINQLLDHLDALDEELLRGTAALHPSGLRVIVQPYDLSQLRQLTAQETERLVAWLRERFLHLVLDVGSQIDASALTAVLRADVVLLVSTPDVPGIRSAQRVLTLLRRLGLSEDRLRLVLNKAQPRVGLSVEEIEGQLGVEVVAELPRADAVACSLDESGRPLRELAPASPLAQALEALWARLHAPSHVGTRRRAWPWSR